jgi:hypothetical protein
MGDRFPAIMPRVAVIVLVALGATTTLTYAAGRKLAAAPAAKTAAARPQLATIVVPDVTKEAYVFAKGQLQDAGFAWKVAGSVQGFAANTVVAQSPPAGTKLLDTGAPLVTLTLALNGGYKQSGEPEDASPYLSTAVHLAEPVAAPATAPPAVTTPAKATTPAPAPKKKKTVAAAPAYPQLRPVAFVVPGARKEPLDEMPLPDRAKALGTWLTAHPKPTNATEKYWLYQNEWVVAGARLGWWRGAEALRTLVAVDARTVALWGVGAKSEALARAALAEVQARSK